MCRGHVEPYVVGGRRRKSLAWGDEVEGVWWALMVGAGWGVRVGLTEAAGSTYAAGLKGEARSYGWGKAEVQPKGVS